jgi:hypothetical protein
LQGHASVDCFEFQYGALKDAVAVIDAGQPMSPIRADAIGLSLREPQAWVGSSLPRWETLVRHARRTNLLPRVAVTFDELGLLPQVPPAPRAHLVAARTLAQAQADAVRREVAHIDRALVATGVPSFCSRARATCSPACRCRGRIFSDIDILVPRVPGQVEAALMLKAEATAKTTPYDQRYYRQWMHELRRSSTSARQTVLDCTMRFCRPRAPEPIRRNYWRLRSLAASRDCVSSRRSIWS